MTKVFISQIMSNHAISQILARRDEILMLVREQLGGGDDVEVVDSFLLNNDWYAPSYCLGLSLQDMSQADLIVFDDFYTDSRGCEIEHQVAVQYELPHLHIITTSEHEMLVKDEVYHKWTKN